VAQAQAAGEPGRAATAWRTGVARVRSGAGHDSAYPRELT
jgi:hypothetical protein